MQHVTFYLIDSDSTRSRCLIFWQKRKLSNRFF